MDAKVTEAAREVPASLVRGRARWHLVAALRRVRIDSALALAEQNRAAESDLQRLQAKLSEAALAEEAALIEGGPTLPFRAPPQATAPEPARRAHADGVCRARARPLVRDHRVGASG